MGLFLSEFPFLSIFFYNFLFFFEFLGVPALSYALPYPLAVGLSAQISPAKSLALKSSKNFNT